MEYSIDEMFISKYVFFNKGENRFIDLPKYGLQYKIVKSLKDDYYENFVSGGAYRYYKKYKTLEEKELKIFWGELSFITAFLTPEEAESGKISYERLEEIYCLINGVKSKTLSLKAQK